jgi:hypothetical protein
MNFLNSKGLGDWIFKIFVYRFKKHLLVHPLIWLLVYQYLANSNYSWQSLTNSAMVQSGLLLKKGNTTHRDIYTQLHMCTKKNL